MQNSLDRLFEGIAVALREDVLPAVDDPYARAQLLAGAELLGNLAARVEWRCADLREEIEQVRAVLAAAPDPPAVLQRPVPEGNDALLAARHDHLEALAELQGDAAAPREPLEEFLAWQLARERALLRTGMYAG